MNIHQVSVIFVEEQDRILVRLNTVEGEELRLWLTRRMLGRVLEPLHDAVGHLEARKTQLPDSSPEARRMLADLKRAEVVKQADFSTPYKAATDKLPLGTKPLLITQMSMTVKDPHQLHIGFEERLPQQQEVRGFQVALESPMLHGFMHLLEAALDKAQWHIASTSHSAVTAGGDDGADEVRPKYLQ